MRPRSVAVRAGVFSIVMILMAGMGDRPSAGAIDTAQWLQLTEGSTPGTAPLRHMICASTDSTVFDLCIPGAYLDDVVREQGSYRIVEVPGEGMLRVAGAPLVPKIVILVACPECEGVRVTSEVSGLTTLNDCLLCPSPREVVRGEPGDEYTLEEFYLDEDAYARDESYPAKVCEILDVGRIRDQKVAWIGVYPVQYNAAQKAVSFDLTP